MWSHMIRPFTLYALLLLANPVSAEDPFLQSAEDSAAAAADYQQYCALCHGDDRQGYANDEAPSLRSESLMRSGYPTHLLYAVAYGRRGTPMGAILKKLAAR
jgi:cytochrome c oxidase cbb3-type subunit 3